MIWRWFQDWRERRAGLREFEATRAREESPLLQSNLNPLNHARMALDAGDTEAAAEHWERARVQLPNAILTLTESFDILIDLKRYEEAETLMRKRHERMPGDRFWMSAIARVAEVRGDHAEALKRWETVTRRTPSDKEGYLGRARCLMAMDRLDEAEKQFKAAIRQDPREARAWADLGKIAERREDWDEVLARCTHLATEFRIASAYAGAARALERLGRIDEAETLLLEPSIAYPRDLEVALTRVHLAKQRGDVNAVRDRWEGVRRADPFFDRGYADGARFLAEIGCPDEADQLLQNAIGRFPDKSWPLREFATLAHNRGDMDEAAARWTALRERFPDG